jgi:two-component system sensor histidine kinase KdpD
MTADQPPTPGAELDPVLDPGQLDRQRTALLRSVTHDLRTPLAAIRAIVTDLYAGIAYDAETRTELLETVCDEVDRLDRLVGNLLSMSRIDAGVLEPRRQAVDLHELVAHRLRALAMLLRDVTVTTAIDEDVPLVDADFGQLEEVLTNLLGNAVRHAPPGSEIEVGARAVETPGSVGESVGGSAPWVVLSVVDHGPGVPPELRDHLFEAFRRGPGSHSTGLGLAICKAIAEAHGGTIRLRDTPGGGATFEITLPPHRDGTIPDEEPA